MRNAITPRSDLQTGHDPSWPNQPPLSIRGVTESNVLIPSGVFFSVDWLRYSVSWPDEEVPPTGREKILRVAFHPSPEISFTGESLINPKGYDTCLGLTFGTVRYHSERPQQKIGVEFTGRDLSGLRSKDVSALDLLVYARTQGARVTRLDLAVDVFGRDANPLDLHKAFLAGELLTAAHEVEPRNRQSRDAEGLHDKDRGVYVGSRRSDRFMRVYDKALEQDKSGVKWTRIELQLGGDVAAMMSSILTEDNFEVLVKASIRGFCKAPMIDWYTNALEGEMRPLPKVGRRDSDRKRWLLKQVLPALRDELVLCEAADDWELFEAFQSTLEMYRNRALDDALGAYRSKGHGYERS